MAPTAQVGQAGGLSSSSHIYVHSLQRREDISRAAHGEGAAFLQVQNLHHAIVNEHRIPPRADPEALVGEVKLHAESLCKERTPVSKHHHLIIGPDGLSPCFHHEGIVHRYTSDHLHTLSLDLSGLLDETRKVLQAASRCEGARNSKQHHLVPSTDISYVQGGHVSVAVEVRQVDVFRDLIADGQCGNLHRLPPRNRDPRGGGKAMLVARERT
mmetsp:Transcript_39684/g.66602  ORF Transcript_39684/g.66602 Transcript_39684/m.66602 type:complete len:213 (+) Transcript_39684:384-1022(+)